MIFIWGSKAYVDLLATGNLVCRQCHNPAAHRLHRVRRKFTFFWIPLFTTSTKHLLDCTFCGLQSHLTAEEAERCAADLRSSYGGGQPSHPQVPQH
ncbi:zinc-ribbon domain-containing protein [Nocardioides litoris]|uniref:zinc-ribbon domain-containing protein n=1 Tax=Nocardioides litoris TaxID=1926648 RepID=UPI00111E5CF5|nr:zinc-ribbon domain-containing protein [Nocardioides litoris]